MATKNYSNEHPKYKKKDKNKNIKVAKKSSAEKALDKQILGAKKHFFPLVSIFQLFCSLEIS